ncbi:MAG: hypothetical protein H6626_04030 [Pseudobdellovibrionaceae bacterium]|nr:hypothetical protein [Bdellovibrionales bacterium]USN48267.1 MAG: hypothetical protein H6626_04030 [Pseudobdellovibrionaceae bacterium]
MSKKGNPLFVDSTKFHGDTITMRVELDGAMPYPDEEVVMRVWDDQGLFEELELRQKEESVMVGSVTLKHQQKVQIQFAICQGESVHGAMLPVTESASYMCSVRWDPCSAGRAYWMRAPGVKAKADFNEESRRNYAAEEGTLVATLINKWGF